MEIGDVYRLLYYINKGFITPERIICSAYSPATVFPEPIINIAVINNFSGKHCIVLAFPGAFDVICKIMALNVARLAADLGPACLNLFAHQLWARVIGSRKRRPPQLYLKPFGKA